MNIAQRLRDKGFKEGFKEGFQIGYQKETITIARELLKNGASFEVMMKSTGLSREELLSLQ